VKRQHVLHALGRELGGEEVGGEDEGVDSLAPETPEVLERLLHGAAAVIDGGEEVIVEIAVGRHGLLRWRVMGNLPA
jgi:hypothetical protein